ncbi:DNA pol epsilon, sub B [Giardia muris]|uniref:DNA polymerase II subunit 2 n=1 Tax=Giardia muris TaxID=5742 RepID=A0A4Z1SNQ7_GIAMU|nr:DNA pol epsilon, sub B [Giardia muris]|eukprot:TNJ26525.1 DNA pol epsilon, sub B [Giardia muris]
MDRRAAHALIQGRLALYRRQLDVDAALYLTQELEGLVEEEGARLLDRLLKRTTERRIGLDLLRAVLQSMNRRTVSIFETTAYQSLDGDAPHLIYEGGLGWGVGELARDEEAIPILFRLRIAVARKCIRAIHDSYAGFSSFTQQLPRGCTPFRVVETLVLVPESETVLLTGVLNMCGDIIKLEDEFGTILLELRKLCLRPLGSETEEEDGEITYHSTPLFTDLVVCIIGERTERVFACKYIFEPPFLNRDWFNLALGMKYVSWTSEEVHVAPRAGAQDFLVILSHVSLGDGITLPRLLEVIACYEAESEPLMIPSHFIIAGDFGLGTPDALLEHLSYFCDKLQSCPRVLARAHFIFVPGDQDVSEDGIVYPKRLGFESIRDILRARYPMVTLIFPTSPFRLTYGLWTLVISTLPLQTRYLSLKPRGDAGLTLLPSTIANLIVQQRYLYPLPGDTTACDWGLMPGALLVPMPHFIITCDGLQPSMTTVYDVTVVCPGSFEAGGTYCTVHAGSQSPAVNLLRVNAT